MSGLSAYSTADFSMVTPMAYSPAAMPSGSVFWISSTRLQKALRFSRPVSASRWDVWLSCSTVAMSSSRSVSVMETRAPGAAQTKPRQ